MSGRLRSALLAAALGCLAALVVATLLAAGVGPMSVDQPLQLREVVGWGARWGALLAVTMGSAAALGAPPPAPLRSIARTLLLTALVPLLLSGGAAALAILAVRLHLWGQHWGLPSRSGHAARLASLTMAEITGWPSAVLGAWWLYCQRLGPGGGQGHG